MLAHMLFYKRVRCFRSSLHAEECCIATLFGYTAVCIIALETTIEERAVMTDCRDHDPNNVSYRQVWVC